MRWERAAKGKVAKAAPKAAAKKGKSKGPDQEEFAHKLLEVCKVLIATVTIVVDEDADSGTITTEEDYMTYGNDLLQLLPEEARLPMMKMAHLYREEVEDELDTLDWIELSDSDDEEDEDEEDLPPRRMTSTRRTTSPTTMMTSCSRLLSLQAVLHAGGGRHLHEDGRQGDRGGDLEHVRGSRGCRG